MTPGLASLNEIDIFDAIIDVRSPAEFADDHVPGAINCPVLDDAQRVEVGTLYKQVSPFAARRLGGAYVSAAIGRHIAESFADKPKVWRPLVMCWRGGMRSGAMVTVLRAVGWDACQLEGGYKAFRGKVLHALEQLPTGLDWRVVAGPTGSGKTRVLQALAARGAQILDLEQLAMHKGSVLGDLPNNHQPSQRAFETALWQRLQDFKVGQPVFVEAESRKIGKLRVHAALIQEMAKAPVLTISASLVDRVTFLAEDYPHWQCNAQDLKDTLATLRSVRGGERIDRWQTLVDEGRYADLIKEMLIHHYDPLYQASQARQFQGRVVAKLEAIDLTPTGISRLANQMLGVV